MSLTHHMTSVSRLRQNFKTNLAKSAAAKWNASCRGKITVASTGPLPSPHFAWSITRLSTRNAGLYVHLRSSHVALTAYLARISNVASATCPTCVGGTETVFD